jgi:hypothetical protein
MRGGEGGEGCIEFWKINLYLSVCIYPSFHVSVAPLYITMCCPRYPLLHLLSKQGKEGSVTGEMKRKGTVKEKRVEVEQSCRGYQGQQRW